jgi:hypothetical protein
MEAHLLRLGAQACRLRVLQQPCEGRALGSRVLQARRGRGGEGTGAKCSQQARTAAPSPPAARGRQNAPGQPGRSPGETKRSPRSQLRRLQCPHPRVSGGVPLAVEDQRIGLCGPGRLAPRPPAAAGVQAAGQAACPQGGSAQPGAASQAQPGAGRQTTVGGCIAQQAAQVGPSCPTGGEPGCRGLAPAGSGGAAGGRCRQGGRLAVLPARHACRWGCAGSTSRRPGGVSAGHAGAALPAASCSRRAGSTSMRAITPNLRPGHGARRAPPACRLQPLNYLWSPP